MSKWDRFNSSVQRLGDDLEFREVRVYTSTSTYDPDTGNYSQSYTEHAASPIRAELREPQQPRMTRDADGSEAEVDTRIFVNESIGIDFTGAGDNADYPDKIEDTESGQEYRVYQPFNEGNGLIRLYGVEI